MADKTVPQDRINGLRQKMKENVGWADNELDILTPKQWSFIDRMHKFRSYKMIAEVCQVNDHCELKPKIGDR